MKFSLFKVFIYSLILGLYTSVSYAFDTKAAYAILVDFDTNEVLFEKNADQQMAPSSMSKLMTLYMVFDRLKSESLKLEDKLTISEKAWKKQGSKMYIHVGDNVSVLELLRGIIIQSGNDACIAIAEGLNGSEQAFVDAMNIKAKEIGLTNSVFKNSTGWPEDGHLMTSRDLSILAKRLIVDFPEQYAYFSELEFVYNGIKQQNRNMLLTSDIGADGLKTGHTDIAGYGITASAVKDNRRLILVVNGLNGTVERANEARAIFQYGFLNFATIKLFKRGDVVTIVDIWGGENEKIQLVTDQDITFTIAKDSIKQTAVEFEYPTPILAPVKRGDQLGMLSITHPKMPLKTFKLIAEKEVVKLGFIEQLLSNFKYRIKKI